jgi:hypothetical protein
MTCPTCHGAAHIRGAACPSCYGTGEPCAEVAPAVVAARLSVRAEFFDRLARLGLRRKQADKSQLFRQSTACFPQLIFRRSKLANVEPIRLLANS